MQDTKELDFQSINILKNTMGYLEKILVGKKIGLMDALEKRTRTI